MLKRKATVAKSAPSNKRSSRPKVSQAKTPPVRRRFVISSKAMKPGTAVAKPVVGNKVQPPAASASPKLPTKLLAKLRGLDVEIVMDQAEADRAERKQPEQAQQAEEEDDSRLEILDDPVRMYMNQMGKVPLLTREQEVEICKKIE